MVIRQLDKLMQARKLTQKDVANIINVSQNAISNIIKRGDLKVSQLNKIAKYFNVPVSYFFEESGTGGNIVQTANGNGNGNNQNIALQNQCSELQQKVNELNEQVIKCQEELIQYIKKEK